jgi:hypothetical protein
LRDDKQPLDARQAGDDVLDHAVDKIILLGIAAHIGEWQDGDRRTVGQCQWRCCCLIRGICTRLAALLDTVDAHRASNVFDAVLAHIGKTDRQLLADLLAYRCADADLAGLGEHLEPCGDIDAVAKDVAFIVDDIAQIDADTEADAVGLLPIGVAVRHSLLDDDGAAHGIDDRSELDQNAVAGGFEDAATVLGDQWIDQLAPIAFEDGEGTLFVRTHQPRISGNVGAEDRRQPSLDAFNRHDALPVSL